MSATEPHSGNPEEGGDDILAAEFVLGVLPSAEQARVAHRVETDAAFASLAAAWEERLLPMADVYRAEDPSPAVKRALDLRLFGETARAVAPAGRWASLWLWRSVAALATAAFLLAVALPQLLGPPAEPASRLIASLTAEGSDVTYLAMYDPETGAVSLAHLAGAPEAGRVFQLWVARGDEAPVSLGVIASGVPVRVSVAEATRGLMTDAAHMAISVEPPGGSPTGQPTGPVVAVGDLLNI